MKKGFALEDERLKNLGGGNYFDENVSEFVEDKVEEKTNIYKWENKDNNIFHNIVITIDKNDELEYLCRKYFDESKFASKIDFRINDAREELNTIEKNSVDLAFIDADKESYPYYFEKVLELLRPGGTMLVDNVLWYGKVMLEEEDKKDPSTKILKEFNEMVTKDERVESIILPIRDGITLIRKK